MIAGDTLAVRVARRRDEAEDIAGFDLVRVDGQPLPTFAAGAHIDVQPPGGPVRAYSLCNPPLDGGPVAHYQIAVLREPASRGGSLAMHERLREGDTLTIGLPRNLFGLQPARRTVLLAGGIGITPLLAMARTLAAQQADFVLHYATRSAARTAFAAELKAAGFGNRVLFHHDDGEATQRFNAANALGRPDAGTQVYVCGPTGFIDHVWHSAEAAGWPMDQLHREYFGAAPAAVAPDSPDGAFTVRVASTGQEVPVAADQTVIAALAAAGVDVLVSCEQGICGTCLTRVLEGQPDHRDQYLTDDEKAANDQFTPCCSRSRTPVLVLDL